MGERRWWFDSLGYWLWRRITHRWACGGRWLVYGGCADCDLMRSYVTSESGV